MKRWHWVAIAFCVAVILPTLIQRPDRTDLGLLYLGVDRLWAGEPVYRLSDANEHTKPPLATIAFAPFTTLSLFWLSRLWDVLNIAVYCAWVALLVRRLPSPSTRWTVGVLATFVLMNPLNAELRLGQYNVLLFAWLCAAGFAKRSVGAGVGLCFAVLFKPTFVMLAPWVLQQVPKPKRVVFAGAVTAVCLVAAYCAVFGWPQFVADMQTWAAFLPQSSEKHLLRQDNHGLPSLLAAWTGIRFEQTLLLGGLACSAVASARFKDGLLSLSCCAAAMIVCSPMAWLQNYALLLPAVVWLLGQWESADRAERVWIALPVLSVFAGVGLLNPTTCKWTDCEMWTWQRFPLWGLAAAIVLVLIKAMDRARRTPSKRKQDNYA